MNNNTIKTIASALDMTYIFGDWTDVNWKADFSQTPVFIDVLPASGSFTNKCGNVYANENRMFAFLDKADLDFNRETNQTTIDTMTTKAMQFVATLNAIGGFEYIDMSEVQWRAIYDGLDANLTGVSIELTLKPIEGTCEDDLIVDF